MYDSNGDTRYTDEAQEYFNARYDYYLDKINNCAIKVIKMAMLHYLKVLLLEERISKLSKRKRKRHRVGEFQKLCFMFLI